MFSEHVQRTLSNLQYIKTQQYGHPKSASLRDRLPECIINSERYTTQNTPTTQDRTERLTFVLFLFVVAHWNKCDQLLYGSLDVGVLRS